MNLRESREYSGVSERTLRRLIKEGKLEAALVGSGSNRHWEVDEESLSGIGRPPSGQLDGHLPDNGQYASGQIECPNCDWLRHHLEAQLEEKDRQIRELHVLLQEGQAQLTRILPAPRRWWRFW